MIRKECERIDLSSGEISSADLYQEAVIRIWTQLPSFQGSDQEELCRLMFIKWLRTTTRHMLINLLEKRRAACRSPRASAIPRPLPIADGDAADSSGTASRIVGSAEQAAHVRAAIGRLQGQERQLVELCFFEGKTLRAAAESLRITYDQARTRFARALEHLRTFLT
jgi:RNA polymerase sigma factor (sigma-70 family)